MNCHRARLDWLEHGDNSAPMAKADDGMRLTVASLLVFVRKLASAGEAGEIEAASILRAAEQAQADGEAGAVGRSRKTVNGWVRAEHTAGRM